MMLKDDAARLAGWRIVIVATDLSTEILKKAQEGLYSQFEVQRGLPITLLMKHFSQEGEKWRISEEIRRMVTYKPFNLLDNPSRSEEHTSELQSLMRISYAVFCLKKKTYN